MGRSTGPAQWRRSLLALTLALGAGVVGLTLVDLSLSDTSTKQAATPFGSAAAAPPASAGAAVALPHSSMSPSRPTPALAQPSPTLTLPGDPLGHIALEQGQPIKIAFWGALSGPFAGVGMDALRGVEMAVAEHGALLGHEILLISEDAWCTPRGGREAAGRLAAEASIVGLIGPVCPAEAAGVATLADAGLTTISPSDISWNRGPVSGYLRTAWREAGLAEAMAYYAYTELGLRRVGLIGDGRGPTDAIVNAFAREFEGLGASVVGSAEIAGSQTELRPLLRELARSGAQGIFYPLLPGDAARISVEARSLRPFRRVPLMTTEGALSERFFDLAGPSAGGIYASARDLAGWPAAYDEFLMDYVERYGESPEWGLHAHAYDAARLLLRAIADVAEESDDHLVVPLAALRQRLLATRDFPGLTGNLTCDEAGSCGAPMLAVFRLTEADLEQRYLLSDPVWRETDRP